MKVLIATGLYAPEIGGPATYAAMLEKEIPKKNIEIKILPFSLVRKYPKIVRHLIYTYKLWRVSKDVKIIYALDPISVGLPALLVSKLSKKPLLVRLGGDYAWEQGRVRFGVKQTLDEYLDNQVEQPLAVKFLAKLQTFMVSKAELIVVPSQYLKSVVMKWGIPDSNIRVIYSALFPIVIDENKNDLRQKITYSYPNLISAARLVPWKGLDTLIKVVFSLQEKYPDILLKIVGSGEEKQNLEKLVDSLNLSKKVIFTGNLSKFELGQAVKAADIFVLNTSYEGLSHQLIEVMNIGTPIVTTNVGGNPELVIDGVNGLLVDFNNEIQIKNAICKLLDNQEVTAKMVASAKLHSRQFNQDLVIEQIEKIFRTYE